MTDIYRNIYPMEAFDGGLNNKYEPNLIAPNESPDCLNVIFDDRGGMQTRPGYSKANTTAVGSYVGEGLFTARFNDGTEKMVGVWNGTAYLFGTATFTTIPSAQSIWTGGRVDMAMYQNLAFFNNGGTPYKYNGTDWTRHGIPQPNSGPSTTSGTAGNSGPAGGDVNYKITYVNSYLVEGDVSAQTTTLTVASTATVSLTSLPLAPQSFGVSARRVYRRSNGSGGSFKLVTTINDNTTTTLVDQVTDANLGAVAPTDQGEPPNWKYILSHQERLWMIDTDSNLWYTELGNPFVVKAASFIPQGDGDGEIARGISVHANMIVTHKDGSAWLMYLPDTTPGNWIRVKSKSKYGLASHFAQADYADRKLFLGKRYTKLSGFMALAGTDTEPNTIDLVATSVRSDSKSDQIEPDVFQFNTTVIDLACAIEYGNKIYFSVPFGNTTINNRVYCFDYQRRNEDEAEGSWVPFTYPVGFNAFTVYGGALYGQASNASGMVYKLFPSTTFSDDGTAINSYGWTKEFHGQDAHIENWKDFRKADFIVETLGNYYMDLTFKVDGDSGVGITRQIDLAAGGAVWGEFDWGEENWGAGIARKKVPVSLGVSGKRIQFKFSNQNTLNQGFHVYPLASLQYNRRGIR